MLCTSSAELRKQLLCVPHRRSRVPSPPRGVRLGELVDDRRAVVGPGPGVCKGEAVRAVGSDASPDARPQVAKLVLACSENQTMWISRGDAWAGLVARLENSDYSQE